MKYKVGDKVRVRNDLVVNKTYGNNNVYFRSGMTYYEGRVVTISKVGNCFYNIKEDSPYNWSWVDEMFEGIVENKKYKVGDKVKIREDLVADEEYGDINYISDMDKWKGKVVTISFADNDCYGIAEDTELWTWSAEMFEDVSDDENETQTVDKTRTVDVADNPKAFHDAFVEMIDFAKEHLTKEQFNEFIYTIYTRGIENAPITEIPVYENIEHNGRVLWKRIKSVEYEIECKNFKDDKIKDYEIRGTK